MTEPQERVREIACDIPAGEVMSYGQIGLLAGLHPRQVGRIVSQISDAIPWWRIVRADGQPATCHGGTAPQLLALEHVPMANGKIDWKRLGGPR